jgi:hypothetical protein
MMSVAARTCLTLLAFVASLAILFLTTDAGGVEQETKTLFVIQKDEMCGYINKSGVVVISPVFERCTDFSEGFAGVKVKGKWGFIDQTGGIVIQPSFDESRWAFFGGLAAVRVHDKWGYIDVKGKVVITPKFSYAHHFSEDHAVVLVGKAHAVIDKAGRLIASPFEHSGWVFHEGLLPVKRKSGWGYIDGTGKMIVAPIYKEARGFSEGLAAVELSGERNQWGLLTEGERWLFRHSSTMRLISPKTPRPSKLTSNGGSLTSEETCSSNRSLMLRTAFSMGLRA